MLRPGRRSVATLVAALLVLLGLAPAPAGAAMPSTGGLGSRGGVVVVDARTGATLLDRGGSTGRIPASVTKLFTVGAALLRLGPSWAPQTRVVATGTASGRTWNGDVYLVGGGDPTLDGSGITDLARQTAAKLGASRLDGRVLADASAFDDWQGGDRTHRSPDSDMGGQLGALTVDRGARTAAPASRAASLFRNALRTAGVTVSKVPATGIAPRDTPVVASVTGPTLAQLAARTLLPSDNFYAETLLKDLASADGEEGACRLTAGLEVVPDLLVPATPADLTCAAQRTATPSTTAGASRLLRSSLGALLGSAPKIYDGSGLTRRNRVSPALVARLLVRLNENDEVAPALRAALPQAGASGTLARRMRGTAAQGRCQAKTGTINGVSALAGYCRTVSGRDVAFAILQNGASTASAHRFQDRFVARLAAKG